MAYCSNQDRDKAIAFALGQARFTAKVAIVYQSISNKLWYVCAYPNIPEGDAINPSVRYVLPMGEVTKLS